MWGPIPSSPPPSLMDQIRLMLAYADDREAKVSCLKSIIRKKQEEAIPPDVPCDLILEAKIRLDNDKKASAQRTSSILALECSPSDEERRHQILQVEKNIGRMLFADEPDATLEFTNTTNTEKEQTDINLHMNTQVRTTETWSLLFQNHTDQSHDLQRHAQPSKDPDHHICNSSELGQCSSGLLYCDAYELLQSVTSRLNQQSEGAITLGKLLFNAFV